jgi:hypothetical protein
MFKVNVSIGSIAKPGDYAEKGFFKDEARLLEINAIEAVPAKEKIDDDAVVLKADKEVKKA